MRISDWSSDVCSSDLAVEGLRQRYLGEADRLYPDTYPQARAAFAGPASENAALSAGQQMVGKHPRQVGQRMEGMTDPQLEQFRSEEHTSELQSLMRISYAVFCLKKKKQ